jgi:splicing factor U2AF subunit
MADYLASIFGTEKDKVNCSFYFKIGACRHGEKCSKVHNKPTFSQTVLLKNLYVNPLSTTVITPDKEILDPNNEEQVQKHFDEIFQELFVEMEAKYGEIEEMNICDNLSEHLAGNTYVKFRYEEDSEKACADLNNRWFNGKPIYAELSPVTDFHEACCRQYQMGECPRGGFCNFMHLKPISNNLRRKLYSVKHREARGGGGQQDDGEQMGGHFEQMGDYYSFGGGGSHYDDATGGMNGGGGGHRGGYGGGGGGRHRDRSPPRSPRGRHGGGGGGGGGGGYDGGYRGRRY